MEALISTETAKRLMRVFTEGGAMTTVELWQLIDYLSSLAARPKPVTLAKPGDAKTKP